MNFKQWGTELKNSIARFLQEYPWSKTQKVKEILLMYIQGELVPKGTVNIDQQQEAAGKA